MHTRRRIIITFHLMHSLFDTMKDLQTPISIRQKGRLQFLITTIIIRMCKSLGGEQRLLLLWINDENGGWPGPPKKLTP